MLRRLPDRFKRQAEDALPQASICVVGCDGESEDDEILPLVVEAVVACRSDVVVVGNAQKQILGLAQREAKIAQVRLNF